MNVDAIVVGAGLSGLTAAYRLYRWGLSVRVVDASDRVGGLMQTHAENGYRVEGGPHTFPSTASAIHALCRELNLSPVAADPAAKKRYVWLRGRLQAVPQGPLGFFTTSLLSWSGKRAVLEEPFRPPMTETEPSVAAFIRYRLGEEMLERLMDPFISGIYAGDVEQLSLPAVFPRLWEWEQSAGSVLKGAWNQRRAVGGKSHAPYQLLSFADGMQALPRALAAALPAESLVLKAPVQAIQQAESGYRVMAEEVAWETPRLILAVPAFVAGRLLEPWSPDAAGALKDIPYQGLAVVHTALNRGDIPHALDGFGFLVPRVENLALLGSIWASALFPDRCPPDQVLLANFTGGAHHPDMAAWSSEALLRQVRDDLRVVFKVPVEPVYQRVMTYAQAIPQYTRGHISRVQRMEEALKAFPGLALAGNYRHGVALNDCVRSGEAAAEAVMA